MPLRAPGPYRLAVVAGTVAVGVFALWLQLGWGGDTATRAVSDVGILAAAGVAGVACLLTRRRAEGPSRLAWLLIGLSAFSWGAGEAAWTVYEFFLGDEVPFPSLADVGYLGAIPLAMVGLLTLAPRAWSRRARVVAALDGAAVAALLLFVAWVLVLSPLHASSEEGLLAEAIGLAYSLGDVAILSIVASIALAGRRQDPKPLRLLALAFGSFAVADFGFAYLTLHEAYSTGHLIDVGWLAAFVLIVLAALHPESLKPPPEAPRKTSWRAAFVPFAALLGALALDLGVLGSGSSDAFLAWDAAAVILLLGLRQAVTVVDNQRLAREAQATLARANELEASRTHYLNAAVVHDLMTPLTVVQMNLDLVFMEGSDPQEREASRGVVQRNVDHIQRLLADIRDIARIQAGQLRLDLRDADVADLVAAAAESFREPASRRGIRFEVLVEGPADVRGDAGRLSQVVYNLLSNAMKFSPDGSAVRVGVRTRGGRVVVSVEDQGSGLTADQMARLFRPFTQVHDDPDVRRKGSGLGLSISKAIVEGHGGRLWCESAGPGRGATFTFDLPLAATPSARPSMAAASAPAPSAH